MMSIILEKLNLWLAILFRYAILIYRFSISPILPACCRYYPTCSNYGLEAIRLHGGIYGSWLTLKRVCHCHPWGGSGIDFVPLPLYRYRFYYLSLNCPQGLGVQRAELLVKKLVVDCYTQY